MELVPPAEENEVMMESKSENFLVALIIGTSFFVGVGMVYNEGPGLGSQKEQPITKSLRAALAAEIAAAQKESPRTKMNPKPTRRQPSPLFRRYLKEDFTRHAFAPMLTYYSKEDFKKLIAVNSIFFYEIYRGYCPCPYSKDAAEKICGDRSAWSRSKGTSPYCYFADVPDSLARIYWKMLKAND